MSDKELKEKLEANGEMTPEMSKAYNEQAPYWVFANDEQYE